MDLHIPLPELSWLKDLDWGLLAGLGLLGSVAFFAFYAIYVFVTSITLYLYNKIKRIKLDTKEMWPAIRMYMHQIGEMKMRARQRQEQLRILFGDGIVELVEELKFQGKISKKEAKAFYKKSAATLEIPDLWHRKPRHPAAVAAEIYARREAGDMTPIAHVAFRQEPVTIAKRIKGVVLKLRTPKAA